MRLLKAAQRWAVASLLAVAVLGGMLVGCGDSEVVYRDDELRIVSLSPAITQVLLELGLGDAVVAVGDFDDLAPPGTPSLGRFVDLDLERLASLAPTHVLAMTGSAGLPLRVHELAEAGRFVLADWEYPGEIDAATALIVAVGEALGREKRTAALAAKLQRQLDAIAALTGDRQRPGGLIVFGTDPVMASGPGTVNDQLLRIAGGRNVAAEARVTAPVYDREALRSLGPEVIFLLQPGAPPLRGGDDPRLKVFTGLNLPAVRGGRVVLLNDPAVLLPGPSMAATAGAMAEVLHPDLAEAIREVLRESP